MNFPPEVEHALLQILRFGILQARLAGWEGDAKLAAFEADHVHNLPQVLDQQSMEGLRYYYDVERPCYLERRSAGRSQFEPHWETLTEFLQHQPAS
jgi:hypothetical protein